MRVRYRVAASLALALFAYGTAAQAGGRSASAPFSNFVPAQYGAVNNTFEFALAGPISGYSGSGYDGAASANLSLADRLTPDIAVDFGADLTNASRFSAYDSTDGLFLSSSAVASPYASLTGGGNYVGSTVALSDHVSMRFGESMLTPLHPEYGMPAFSYDPSVWGSRLQVDPRQAQTSLAGVDWNFASWGGLDMIATQTSEQNGVLGNFGPLSVAKSANTSAVGVSAHVGFGNGWVTTFSYNQGITQLSLRPAALASNSSDTLQSRAYGFVVAKHGLFGDDDSLGFAVSRPLQVYSGSVNLGAADGIGVSDNLAIGHIYPQLSGAAPETDLELGYVTTFMNGALALQANAGYQMNVPGLGGANSLSVISRAKINF